MCCDGNWSVQWGNCHYCCWGMNKVLFLLSWIVGIIGLLFALLGIIKLFTLSSKSLPILFFCFGILLIGLVILPYSVDLSQIRWLRLTYRLVCGLVAIGVLCGGIVSCFMAFGVHTWKGKDFSRDSCSIGDFNYTGPA